MHRIKRTYTESYRDLFFLSIPTLVSFLLQNLYSLADIFWISRLGTAPVAAVSLSGIVVFVVFTASQFLSVGTMAFVSQLKGQKRWGSLKGVVSQVLAMALSFGAVLSVLVYLLAKPAIYIMGGRGQVLSLAITYIRVFSFGALFFILSFVVNAVFRAAGDTLSPMVFLLLSNLTNIVLDPIFIFLLGLGVAGAALATVVAQLLAAGYGLVKLRLVLGKRVFLFRRPDLSLMGKIVKIGLPSGVQFTLMGLSMLVLLRIVVFFGDAAVAAVGIASRVVHFIQVFPMAISISASIIVGQFLGMKAFEKARRTVKKALAANELISLLFLVLIWASSSKIMNFFTRDVAVSSIGAEFLRYFMLSQLFIVANITFSAAFRASGDTLPPMYVAMLRMGVLVALSLALAKSFALKGILIALVISAAFSSAAAYSFFRWRHWCQRAVTLRHRFAPAPGGQSGVPAGGGREP